MRHLAAMPKHIIGHQMACAYDPVLFSIAPSAFLAALSPQGNKVAAIFHESVFISRYYGCLATHQSSWLHGHRSPGIRLER